MFKLIALTNYVYVYISIRICLLYRLTSWQSLPLHKSGMVLRSSKTSQTVEGASRPQEHSCHRK